MANLLMKVPYSPFIDKKQEILRLTTKQMRETLIKIIVVSGMDIAAAEQIDEVSPDKEDSSR